MESIMGSSHKKQTGGGEAGKKQKKKCEEKKTIEGEWEYGKMKWGEMRLVYEGKRVGNARGQAASAALE